jgi:hypothetical protein
MKNKFKRGDIREDGKVFWRYIKRLNKEEWMAKEQFDLSSKKATINRKRCYYNDIERERKNNTRWKKNNVQKNRENSLKWQRENPKKACDRSKRWHRKNPHVMIAVGAKYRASKKNQTPELSKWETETIKEIYKSCKRLSDCTGIKFHVDHIIPISKGGIHHPFNLQILPARINIQKSNKIL